MRFLIVNDDGIEAPGIAALARAAKQFGEVTVVGPAQQCSAMSMRLTIFEEMEVKEVPFPVEGVKAWRLDGSPADCVKMAMNVLLDQRPDWILSGVNKGYNTGRDILYSGTLGAATEGLLFGIPSAAFSTGFSDNTEVMDAYLPSLLQEVLGQPTDLSAVWNINFPACPLSELKGIERNVRPASIQLYADSVEVKHYPDGRVTLHQLGVPCKAEDADLGTDVRAVLTGYIAVGKVWNPISCR